MGHISSSTKTSQLGCYFFESPRIDPLDRCIGPHCTATLLSQQFSTPHPFLFIMVCPFYCAKIRGVSEPTPEH